MARDVGLADEKAMARIEKHEAICAERYGALNEKIESLATDVRSLKELVSMGNGGLKMMAWIGAFIIFVITVWNTVKGWRV